MKEIIKLYDRAEKYSEKYWKQNNLLEEYSREFYLYQELKRILKYKIGNDIEKLNAYKMQCENFRFLDANISIASCMVSFVALATSMASIGFEYNLGNRLKETLEQMKYALEHIQVNLDNVDSLLEAVNKISVGNGIFWAVILLGTLGIGILGIYMHKKEQKHKSALFVLKEIEKEILQVADINI